MPCSGIDALAFVLRRELALASGSEVDAGGVPGI